MVKICFAGLGSIGQRHLKNVIKILEERSEEYCIDAVRSGKTALPPEIAALLHRQYTDVEQIPDDYDIFFITNPTVNHLETLQKAVAHTRHLFLEKPVFHEPFEDIETLAARVRGVCYVACPLRYSPCLEYLRERIKGERIYSIRAISSSYLPDWRKGTDYRKIYSADRNRGGGVTLDLIHELDYLTELFGMPRESLHVQGKYSDLEIDSDDLSLYILRYEDKLAEVHLDYFGRESVRQLELFCREYVIRCDFIRNLIQYVYADHVEEFTLRRCDMYQEEMRAFLRMTEGKALNVNDLHHANEVLKLAVGR